MLIFYQNQFGKNEMARRTSNINANGKYFNSVYFHIQWFRASGCAASGSEIPNCRLPVSAYCLLAVLHRYITFYPLISEP